MSKFIIKKAKTGLMFNFVASNGEVVATSEVYTTKKACKNGIASVQRNAESEVENLADKDGVHIKGAKYETYKDKRGEFRFRLKLHERDQIDQDECEERGSRRRNEG